VTNVLSAFAEYKPRPSTSLRAQLNYIGSIDTERLVYAGARDRTALVYTERRELEPEARINVRLRQTF
jgi:hypothetical protein